MTTELPKINQWMPTLAIIGGMFAAGSIGLYRIEQIETKSEDTRRETVENRVVIERTKTVLESVEKAVNRLSERLDK